MNKQRIQEIIRQIDQEERAGTGTTAPETPDEDKQTYPHGNVSPFATMSKEDLLRLIAHLILAEDQAPIVDSHPPTITVDEASQPFISMPETQADTQWDEVVLPARKPISYRLIALLAVGALLLGSLGSYFLLPLLYQSATITITPTEQSISTNATITAAPGTKDAQAIHARFLPSLHQSLRQTIAATGTAHQNATIAHGTITFYNGLPEAQTIPAGAILTGTDGVHVTTDAALTVPGAILPTEGVATISAHATAPGTQGNISASAIHGQCCLQGILAYNAPFYGGNTEREYHVATTSDITTATTNLKTHLTQTVQQAITNQLTPDEALLPPQCTLSASSDHQAGEEAVHITVTAEETCTAAVYSQTALPTLATSLLQSQAEKAIGQASRLQGDAHTVITGVSVQGTTIIIRASVSGLYRHTFTGYALQHMQAKIAHMTRTQAYVTLLQTPGIANVQVTSTQDTLPQDANAIHIIVS